MNLRSNIALLVALAFSMNALHAPVLAAPLLSTAALVRPVAKPRAAAIELLKVDEALALAFPDCTIKRGTVYLTKEQKAKASKLAKKKLELNIVHPYEAFDKAGKLVGTAYFDTHKIRTKRESLMIVVAPDSKITRIEVCAFGEPSDYMPSGRWYAQFLGKKLNDNLNLGRDIQGITGATLSGQATTNCARRVLALHAAIQLPPAPPKEEKKKKEKKRVTTNAKPRTTGTASDA